MDISLLRLFVAAAEEKHFARAAETLDVSRMTVSASVRALEAELGYPLFDRTAETTTLTDEGVAFLATARREIAAVPAAAPAQAPPAQKAGGKAKASKGKGRTPDVKGQIRPGKRRQSR